MRRPMKPSAVMNNGGEQDNYNVPPSAPTPNDAPATLDEVQAYQEENGSKVYELLNKMSSLDAENDGAHLANFSPLPPPNLNSKTMFMQKAPEYSNLQNANHSQNMFSSDNRSLGNLPNYQQVYNSEPIFKNKPYYANMGIQNGGSGDSKLMERINYMVHLLEEQQHEKTANITEEFLLYTFLGVFVIYVVDTFSRNGKYVR
jgi:hypothetical protein